jgi:hypothetical protein
MTDGDSIREGQVLEGPLFSEPTRVETVAASAAWTPERGGSQTGPFRWVGPTKDHFATLTSTSPALTNAGHDGWLWLGLQVYTFESRKLRLRRLAERIPRVTPASLALQRYRASIAE